MQQVSKYKNLRSNMYQYIITSQRRSNLYLDTDLSLFSLNLNLIKFDSFKVQDIFEKIKWIMTIIGEKNKKVNNYKFKIYFSSCLLFIKVIDFHVNSYDPLHSLKCILHFREVKSS